MIEDPVRPFGGRQPGVDHHRQGVVVDNDEFGGVGGLGRGLGHHHGHRLAHEPHPIGGQDRPVGAVGEPRYRAGNRSQRLTVPHQVGRREHLDDAGSRPGLVGVDGDDPGVGLDGGDEVSHRRPV